MKVACGLFDRPRPADRPWSSHRSFGSAEHREVAREAVRKSLVLLKHQDGVLPLDRGARILVAGKNAHNRGHQCGGFTLEWQGVSGNDRVEGGTSIWEGIREMAPGAKLSVDASAALEEVFDAAVVVIGEKPYAEGMGDLRAGDTRVERGSSLLIQPGSEDLHPYGDTLDLSMLHPEDLETLRAVTARGIPVVAVLVSGRPLVVNRELEEASAFVAAWLPGSEGQGVADVLFGEVDFQGRLSFSWPAHDQQTPNLGDDPYAPLFPYGFGMRMKD